MENADEQVFRLIAELLEVPVAERPRWVAQHVPDDSALRERLLAAVDDDELSSEKLAPIGFVVPAPTHFAAAPASIGRYKVLKPLGGGGMGRVFLARDPNVGREVAIKLIRDGFNNEEFRARFWREARAAGRLRHENIVTVFDVDEFEGQPFLVMEYVPGRTMSDIISRREPFSLERRLLMIEGVCAGLSCAHAAGVVHRDVKPANILVDDDGLVKILDFGVAKAVERTGEDPMTRLTAEQTLIGTVGYLAPEHLSGAPPDSRSDMFAAAVVAYELLTYSRPFGDVTAIIPKRTLTGDVTPMSSLNVDVPAAIERIVLRGLSVLPEDRFRDMATMERQFAAARVDLSAPAVSLSDETGLGGYSIRTTFIRASIALGAVGILAVLLWTSGRQTSVARVRNAGGIEPPAASSPVSAPPVTVPGTSADGREPVTAKRATAAGGRKAAETSAPGLPIIRNPPTVTEAVAPTPDNLNLSDLAPLSPGPSDSGAPSEEPSLEPSPAPVNEPAGAGAPPLLSADAESRIHQALRAFETAFQDRNTPALRSIQPTLSPNDLSVYDSRFLSSRSYTVKFSDIRVSMVPPNRAIVDCLVAREVVSDSGAPRRNKGRARIELEMEGAAWFIKRTSMPTWW